jgi:GT2 family glycosyltransferase
VNTTIGVIILTKDLKGLLDHCLRALYIALDNVKANFEHQIVIVDNCSNVPFLKAEYETNIQSLIRFDTNTSFARANNIAVKKINTEYVCLLNNDVFLHPFALCEMIESFQTLSVDIVGTRMIFPDNTIQHCGVIFGPDEVGPYHRERMKPSLTVPRVTFFGQAVTGACLMTRRSFYNELQGLDETFGFGLEDIDFCLRARQSGAKIVCCQKYDSLHFESMTPGRISLDIDSRQRFMTKWQGKYTIDG